ncbi:MAG: hypothetical protein HY043_23190, partial [Verrucomicrobia bacterium]|nr:hypothetical protein [Verrucomicrobiota bacterium]
LSYSLPAVVERGPHHAVTEVTKQIQWTDGRVEWVTNRFTEIANGMSVLDAKGQYQPAQAVFEMFNNGVIARQTAHQVIIAPSPVADVPVDVLMPDGQRLTSRVIGINLYDSASGQSTLIGETRDCAGVLVAPDTVVFAGAFDGVDADLVYHLTRGGISQEIILRENLSEHAPILYKFDPASTRVEVVTEFFNPPQPGVTEMVLVAETDPQKRATEHEPDFSDQMLTWPTMLIGPGQAFAEDASTDAAFPSRQIIVGKRLDTIGGRTLLFEAVTVDDLQPLLDKLPDGKQANANPPKDVKICATRQEILSRLHAAKPVARKIQVAQAAPRSKGLVLDYNLVTTITNFTFRGDTTYFVTNSSAVNISGTTIIEGGTVIKFNAYTASDNNDLNILGPLICNTTPYRPAIFTSKDDNSVGEAISGSTGSPSGYYAYRALNCYVNQNNNFVHDVQFRYALMGCDFYGMTGHVLRHAQFVNCNSAVELYNAGTVAFQNILFQNITAYLTDAYYTTMTGEHLTVNASGIVAVPLFGNMTNSTFAVTNSLFVNVTNIGTITSVNNATNTSAATFQTVGAGAHYLAAGSAYRNAGTTNINAALATDLKTRTTYPPIILTNHFTVNTTLSPQAQRDTDTPDLGYHYAPLDYMWTTLNLDTATLVLTNGVAIANYGSQGTTLKANAYFYSEGSPVNMNHMVRPYAVQEQPVLLGSPGSGRWFLEVYPYLQPTEIRFRFTEISLNAEENSKRHFVLNAGRQPNVLAFTDCQWRNVYTDWGAVDSATRSITLTNNLLEYCQLNLTQNGSSLLPITVNSYNNTFHAGTVAFAYSTNANVWTIKDNLFEGITMYLGSQTTANSNNGYTTNVTVLAGGTNNKTNLVADYQTGSLGSYYFPTNGGSTSFVNLLNTGSRAASAAGLYHYTTTTNNVKETSSTVDIGFHYVAVNSSGLPFDTDGDGIPDYYEDRNGNGTYDSATETDWQTSNSGNGASGALTVFTPLQ